MARSFASASTEYLQIAQGLITGDALTFACWFYATQNTAAQTLMWQGDSANANGYITMYVAGATAGDPIAFGTFGTANEWGPAVSTTGYSINTWHHACGVRAADNDHTKYLDGGSSANSTTNTPQWTPDRFAIGAARDSTPGYYFDGRIAEAAIWDVALTADEVAVLAAGYSPLFVHPQNLVSYWALIRDEDQDRVGGNDLTAYNTPSIANHVPVIYPAPVLFSYGQVAVATRRIFVTHV